MGKLDGKVAVVTGGSSGMALASAKRFVEEGAYVFITGRRQEALDEAVKLIGRNVTGAAAWSEPPSETSTMSSSRTTRHYATSVLWDRHAPRKRRPASTPRGTRQRRPAGDPTATFLWSAGSAIRAKA